MSAKSDALERAVSDLIMARTALDAAPGARARAGVDRAFARLASLTAARVRYFTRRYGLSDAAEDAQQACAIALHRAVDHYDPARARFTTFINWQVRAELQSLRLRLHGDPRCAGRRDSVLVSLDALRDGGADAWLPDPDAEMAAERAAADRLAARTAERLADGWAARRRIALLRGGGKAGAARVDERVAAERALVHRQLTPVEAVVDRLRESDRHIVRRALADIRRNAERKLH